MCMRPRPVLGQRLKDFELDFRGGMIGKCLHGIQSECLGPDCFADAGMNKPVPEAFFDGNLGRTEGHRDTGDRLIVGLHHPGKGFKLVNRRHWGLGDVLSQRDGSCQIAIGGHDPTFDLRFACKGLLRCISSQFL